MFFGSKNRRINPLKAALKDHYFAFPSREGELGMILSVSAMKPTRVDWPVYTLQPRLVWLHMRDVVVGFPLGF